MLDSQTIVKKCSINIPPILHSIQLAIISPPMEKTIIKSAFSMETAFFHVGCFFFKFPDLIGKALPFSIASGPALTTAGAVQKMLKEELPGSDPQSLKDRRQEVVTDYEIQWSNLVE